MKYWWIHSAENSFSTGSNHVTKSPEDRYVYPNDEQLFKEFRNWGINCIRYGINWDGLEPEPGQYNESYLQEIDRRVRWAEENGIYLILDMHQDLFGRKFGNGASRNGLRLTILASCNGRGLERLLSDQSGRTEIIRQLLGQFTSQRWNRDSGSLHQCVGDAGRKVRRLQVCHRF